MQGSALLVHLCDKLDKISRDFLWQSTDEKRKMHLVGWNRIVKPKKDECLGIQSIRAKNIASLTNLNWRMYQEKDALWEKVILNKYWSTSRGRVESLDKLPLSPN